MNSTVLTEDNRLSTVLVATDFSAGANSALLCAIEIAKIHGARIQFVHAIDVRRTIPSELEACI